jgi:hypothetical protein
MMGDVIMNDTLHRTAVIVTGFVGKTAECHYKLAIFLLRFQPSDIRVVVTLARQVEGWPLVLQVGCWA